MDTGAGLPCPLSGIARVHKSGARRVVSIDVRRPTRLRHRPRTGGAFRYDISVLQTAFCTRNSPVNRMGGISTKTPGGYAA